MVTWKLVGSLASVILAGQALGQSELVGYHQYPQFRTLIGLPGSAFPLTKDGKVDYAGALSFSTPIAYGLAPGRFVFGINSTSPNLAPHLPRHSGKDDLSEGNGTGQLLYGIDLKEAGRLTPAILFLSGRGDAAVNLQWTGPQIKNSEISYAVGVVDIGGGGGSSGTNNPGDGDKSTSFYGVVTYQFDRWDLYASIGAGTRRYEGIFGNASITLVPNVKGYVEYDTFNWNFGAAWVVGLGGSEDRKRALSVHAGVVDGRYLSTSLSISF